MLRICESELRYKSEKGSEKPMLGKYTRKDLEEKTKNNGIYLDQMWLYLTGPKAQVLWPQLMPRQSPMEEPQNIKGVKLAIYF